MWSYISSISTFFWNSFGCSCCVLVNQFLSLFIKSHYMATIYCKFAIYLVISCVIFVTDDFLSPASFLRGHHNKLTHSHWPTSWAGADQGVWGSSWAVKGPEWFMWGWKQVWVLIKQSGDSNLQPNDSMFASVPPLFVPFNLKFLGVWHTGSQKSWFV